MNKYIKFLDGDKDWCVIPDTPEARKYLQKLYRSRSIETIAWNPCTREDRIKIGMLKLVGEELTPPSSIGWVHDTENEHYYLFSNASRRKYD